MQIKRNVTIRAAQSHDLPALVAIEQACFETDRISARQMAYLLRRGKTLILVAEVAGLVVAYALVFIPVLPRPARLYSIAVSEAYRGQKIAFALMQTLLTQTAERGYTAMRLEVRASQQATQAFYAKLGFKVITKISNYYQDGEEAIRMECALFTPTAAITARAAAS